MTHMKKNRRILFLLPHLHKGGMQRAVSNISLALPDEFIQYVGFFGTDNPGFKFNAKMHNFNIDGSLKTGPVKKVINAFLRLQALRRFVYNNQIDIVVSFGEIANLYNLITYHKAKKIISSRVSLNESIYGGIYGCLYKGLIKICYPFTDLLVAVSEDLGRQMSKLIKNNGKIKYIPNLYHVRDIRNLSQEDLPEKFSFLENKRFILNVGTLTFQKGQDDLLKIFANISKIDKDLLLVILGQGEWKEYLQEQSVRLGISERVVFVDFEKNPYRYMAKATVFCFPSRYEGFPNALIEAMICGAPVVAFDCPTGPREILGDSEFGILIENRSLEKASEAICAFLDDDLLKKKFQQLSLIRSNNYSAEHIIQKWVDLLS